MVIQLTDFHLKAPTELKTILDPKDNLINLESGIEEINLPDEEKFLTKTEREVANKLLEYRAIPSKKFINESYFLYGKENIIKNHLSQLSINKLHYMALLAIFQEK